MSTPLSSHHFDYTEGQCTALTSCHERGLLSIKQKKFSLIYG